MQSKNVTGIAHLIQSAKGGTPLSPGIFRIFLILEGKYYYSELGPRSSGQPPFPMCFEVAYSEQRDEKSAEPIKPLIGIEKHKDLWLVGTGLRIEQVDAPKWWGDRDKGIA